MGGRATVGIGASGRPYIRQSALTRRLFNHLVLWLGRKPALAVRGRRTGRPHIVPFDGPFTFEGRRYLVSPIERAARARCPEGARRAEGEPRIGRGGGYADPEVGAGYAYVTNRMGPQQGGDPRELAVRAAFHRALGQPATDALAAARSRTGS